MSLRKGLTRSFWQMGLAMVGLIGVCQSTLAQNVAAQSQIDVSVRRQSGGWQPTVTTPDVQTAYFQAQSNSSGGMPVLPTGGPGLPAGDVQRNAGQLPAFPGAGDMPTAVSPPTTLPESLAAPQLPMINRYDESPYPNSGQGAGDRSGGPPNYSHQTSQGYPDQGFPPQNFSPQNFPAQGSSSAAAAQSGSSGRVPAQLASTELRTIQGARDAQPGGRGATGSGLREMRAQPGGSGLASDGRPAAESFTSGLPYVTPAPRGRYATSPYQPAVFQSTDYRSPQVPAQFASSSSVPPGSAPAGNSIATQATMPNFVGAAPPTYLTAQQAALPQYRYPQPGVYPTAYQCTQPAPSVPSTGAVPGGYIPPTLPPNLTPNLYTPNNAGYRPLFSLGQENYNVQLGRGIIGQPTAYVPGQHIRNFLRYLSP